MFYCNTQNLSLHHRFSLNRFADFGLWIAQKCTWQPGSARTRWGEL